jgi:hypothetical protein
VVTVRAKGIAVALALASVSPAALAATAAPAIEFGTLFHTPEERMRLDRLRRGDPDVPVAAGEARSTTPTLTGFVRRSDGRHTVWIDGAPLPVTRPGADALLDPAAVGTPPGEETLRIERKKPR